jgi:hypothetical protein
MPDARAARRMATIEPDAWPRLPRASETTRMLHLCTQVMGKVLLTLAPHVNHWWSAALHTTARGLTTGPMPVPGSTSVIQLDLDLVGHELVATASDGGIARLALGPMTVARFHAETMRMLRGLGAEIDIWTTPVELADRVPFEEDDRPREYDADEARRIFQALLQAERVLQRFRARWTGKSSPVHFFWGSFDLAVTRFSGRAAPPHPGAPHLARFVAEEAYTQEVSSAGWWPGDETHDALFYAYAYPEPSGYRGMPVEPEAAAYDEGLREFVLPYEAVRASRAPEETLTRFLEATFDAAAEAADWPRRHERPDGWRPSARDVLRERQEARETSRH